MASATLLALVFGGLGLISVWISSQEWVPGLPADVDRSTGTIGSLGGSQPTRTLTPGLPGRRRPARDARMTLSRSRPVALDIPAIGVHSVVQHLGQASDGSLETPAVGPHYNEAAWYRHSPTPGSLGPSILLGHVDSAADGPSVFFRLGELRSGNRIAIAREDGTVAIFVVNEIHRYPKDEFPTQLVYGDIDHAGLRLVTCGGAFDSTVGHYEDNIVVYASLERSRDS